MVDILKTPFPQGYYKKDGWLDSIISHYGEKQGRLAVEVMQLPISLLTESMYDVVEIYGDFPEIVYKALGQTIDPLFEPEEYQEKVYKVLYDAGIKENRPLLLKYADGLLNIRLLFQKDLGFYNTKFPEEIMEVGYEELAEVISDITKIHVNQFRKIIAGRTE